MKSSLNDIRNLAREIEAKRKLQEKAKEDARMNEYLHLHSAAEDKKRKTLESLHDSKHVKVEAFLGRIRFDYAIIFVCVTVIISSLWTCRDILMDGINLFKGPKTNILQSDSRESAEVNEQLHKMFDGVNLTELLNSGKVSLGNVSGPRKDEMCGNLNLLSGQDFTVNAILARRDPESYSAFCSFNKAGGYIIELARSEKGFSIIKIDSDN